jgi:signal transduction histidine kinase
MLVFIILSLVGLSIYYFSYTSRINTVKTRLTNRAITFCRLLSTSELFSNELVKRIDSLTAVAYTNRSIQAYDYKNSKFYEYYTLPGDVLNISSKILDDARVNGVVFFSIGQREAVAYHYVNDKARIVMVVAGQDEEGKQNLRRLSTILLLSLLGGLAIAVLGGYFFSRGLLKPIKKIADDVNEISAQNISRRIKTREAKDEWYYLSNTLNSLLNRLQESFDLQRRFISNASHELSTPLTSISSQLEVSLQRERGADEYRKVMYSILEDVRHMAKLTQTLLEFAKASGTAGGLEIELIRIDEILYRLPAEISKINKAYSVSFEFNQLPAEDKQLLVFGNEELLFTAIKNIVVNACKYSSDNRAIIKLSVKYPEITIQVQDDGVGIPENELTNIFQPFYRINSVESPGFGLGLPLASRIIKLHKGTIEVTSKVNEGSVFTIRFQTGK